MLIAFVLGLHWDMVTGAIPATGDHMIHMFKGWLMAEKMIPSGRLTGWSNMAFAGYPAGVYYPILGDLFIAFTRYVTFGLLSWERTYAIAFLILLVTMHFSVYAIARCAAGQVGSLLAAVLSIGDVGAWPQGGHFCTVLWAVWPFSLGLALTMFTVRSSEGVLVRPLHGAWGKTLKFAVLLALTVLAHPMTVFFLGIALPLFALCFIVSRNREIIWHRAVGRIVFTALIAFFLTLFWTVPWLSGGTEWTLGWPSVGFGGLWLPLEKMLVKVVQNDLFKNFYWISWALGLIGIFLSLTSRRLWPTFLALLLIVAFVMTGLFFELGDSLIGRKVQMERMAAFMKFVWFALAGVAVDRIGSWIIMWWRKYFGARSPTMFAKTWCAAGPTIIGIFLIALITIVGWKDSYGKVARIGRLGGEMWHNIVQAENWIGQRPRGPLERVLYQPGELCLEGDIASPKCDEIYHRHIFASGPIRTERPRLKFGYEATAIFRNLPIRHRWPSDAFLIRRMVLEDGALKNLHVRWVVSLVEFPEHKGVKEVRRFGSVIIYSVEAGKEPPVRLKGPGKLTLLEFKDERVRVRIEGASSNSQIEYPIAYYYPWHAYHEGALLPIKTRGVLPKMNEILMTVPARNGVTELKYVRPLFERVAGWLSLLVWMIVFTLSLILIDSRRSVRR